MGGYRNTYRSIVPPGSECRFCGWRDRPYNMHSIFDNRNFVPILNNLLRMNMRKNDGFPSKACQQCYEQGELVISFCNMVWKTDVKHRQRYGAPVVPVITLEESPKEEPLSPRDTGGCHKAVKNAERAGPSNTQDFNPRFLSTRLNFPASERETCMAMNPGSRLYPESPAAALVPSPVPQMNVSAPAMGINVATITTPVQVVTPNIPGTNITTVPVLETVTTTVVEGNATSSTTPILETCTTTVRSEIPAAISEYGKEIWVRTSPSDDGADEGALSSCSLSEIYSRKRKRSRQRRSRSRSRQRCRSESRESISIPQKQKQGGRLKQDFNCKKCSVQFKTREEYELHICYGATEITYECRYCDRPFLDRAKMTEHKMKCMHSKRKHSASSASVNLSEHAQSDLDGEESSVSSSVSTQENLGVGPSEEVPGNEDSRVTTRSRIKKGRISRPTYSDSEWLLAD